MNTTKSGYKVSKMMELTSTSIFWIFIMQCLFSLAGAIYSAYWSDENLDNPYLLLNYDKTQKYDIAFMILTIGKLSVNTRTRIC